MADYPRRLTDRITLLGNPYASIYWVRGDRASALLECGVTATAGQAIDQLTRAGADLGQIEYIFMSHGHADHVAGGPALKKLLPRARLMASPETADLLTKPKIRKMFAGQDDYYTARLIEFGAVNEPVQPQADLEGCLDGTIEPGQVVDLGGASIEVLDVPGHCLGGLGFYCPEEKAVFPSDSMGFFLPPDVVVANFYVSYDDYRATYDKLLARKADWICPAHSGAYRGDEAAGFIDLTRREMARIEADVEAAGDDETALAELKKDIYDRHYIRLCRLFSPELMEYCTDLLIRRVKESSAG